MRVIFLEYALLTGLASLSADRLLSDLVLLCLLVDRVDKDMVLVLDQVMGGDYSTDQDRECDPIG